MSNKNCMNHDKISKKFTFSANPSVCAQQVIRNGGTTPEQPKVAVPKDIKPASTPAPPPKKR